MTSPDRVAGRLVLVATPIGNLGDLSPRAVESLRAADAIACEDTRHTRKLLAHAAITGKRLLAVHEHNETDAAAGVVGLLEAGQSVALVTDAGTPAISDPGTKVVRAVLDASFEVEAVPGPAALIVALIVSGLPTERFCFEGFLPRSGAARKDRVSEISVERRTVVMYEAPHRIIALLHDLVTACGAERRVSVSRELTKRFEQTWRGRLDDAVAGIGEPRGEYVVVLEGGAKQPTPIVDDASVQTMIATHRAAGATTRDAVDAVTAATGRARRDVYGIATTVSRPAP